MKFNKLFKSVRRFIKNYSIAINQQSDWDSCKRNVFGFFHPLKYFSHEFVSIQKRSASNLPDTGTKPLALCNCFNNEHKFTNIFSLNLLTDKGWTARLDLRSFHSFWTSTCDLSTCDFNETLKPSRGNLNLRLCHN